jgi:uncharacterized protein
MDEKILKLVKERYEEGDFKYHISAVVKNAMLLADKLKADKKVVEMAAYLHDIGRAHRRKQFIEEKKQFFKKNEHHLTGSEETKEILKKLNYDNEFVEKVAHCVLTHRGRAEPNPETLEAEIISCADAMAHFDTFPDLFALFLRTTDSFEEAIIGIEQKMERNWNKKLTLSEAKEIVKDKYEAIMLLIKSTKEYF